MPSAVSPFPATPHCGSVGAFHVTGFTAHLCGRQDIAEMSKRTGSQHLSLPWCVVPDSLSVLFRALSTFCLFFLLLSTGLSKPPLGPQTPLPQEPPFLADPPRLLLRCLSPRTQSLRQRLCDVQTQSNKSAGRRERGRQGEDAKAHIVREHIRLLGLVGRL